MHLLRFTQPADDQKIAERIQRGELSVYDFAGGGQVWADEDDGPRNPQNFFDPIKRTGTEG